MNAQTAIVAAQQIITQIKNLSDTKSSLSQPAIIPGNIIPNAMKAVQMA